MADKPHPFHVIDGTPAPDTPVERRRARMRAQPKPAHMLQCRRCSSRTLIEVKTGMEYYNNKPRGGTKQLVCAICLVQGELVVIA